MSNAAISFILPIYNVELYLTDAIESILKQEISKEIILVDDGSTDSSLNIALNYARKYPFIYVIHSQNKGVSAARNTGLRLAKGEYIIFIDPDDVFDKSIDFKEVYQWILDEPVDIVKGQYIKIINNKELSILPVNKEVCSTIATFQSFHQFLETALPDNWFIPLFCLIIKRDFLIKNSIYFNEEITYAEDVLFEFELLVKDGSILELPYIFSLYQVRENSATTKIISDSNILSRYKVIQILFKYLELFNGKSLQNATKYFTIMMCNGFVNSINDNIHLHHHKILLDERIINFSKLSDIKFK